MTAINASSSGKGTLVNGVSGKMQKTSKAMDFPKPNLEEYQTKIAEERRIISELFKKMTELTNCVKECRSGQSDYLKQRDDLRRSLDVVTQQIDTLEAERASLFSRIDEGQKTGRDMKSKVQSLKRNLGFQSEQEIDAKIRAIERHMLSKRLSVQEENKMIAQIKQLKNNKPLVGEYASLEANANSHTQVSVLPLKVKVDELRDEIKLLQTKKREMTDRVRTLIVENQKSLSPVNEFMDEKDKLKKEIAIHRQEERRLLNELETKTREYRVHITQVQRETFERRREEQKRRQAEVERENLRKQLEQVEEEGWSPEYQLTYQTVLYLRTLVNKLSLASDVHSSPPPPFDNSSDVIATTVIDGGQVLMKPKNQRDDEFSLPPKKKQEKKSKKNAVLLNQPLVHDITTLGDFERLNVATPFTLEDCPGCLRILENKLELLKNEQMMQRDSVVRKKKQLLSKLEALNDGSTELKTSEEDLTSALNPLTEAAAI